MSETDDRKPRPPSSRVVKRKERDIVHVGEHVALTGRDTDGVTGVRDFDSSGQSHAADRHADGSVSFEIHGTSRQGEAGNVDVCQILVNRLNRDGANWSKPVDVSKEGPERWVDCKSYDGPNVLKMQVIRADHDVWRSLNEHGSVKKNNLTTEDSVAIVCQSIHKKKKYSQPNDLVLVLDATETAPYAFEPLVRLFRERHGQWATSLGFKAIWIVGPNEELTHRLDAGSLGA